MQEAERDYKPEGKGEVLFFQGSVSHAMVRKSVCVCWRRVIWNSVLEVSPSGRNSLNFAAVDNLHLLAPSAQHQVACLWGSHSHSSGV